jgi:hypothetical protein
MLTKILKKFKLNPINLKQIFGCYKLYPLKRISSLRLSSAYTNNYGYDSLQSSSLSQVASVSKYQFHCTSNLNV